MAGWFAFATETPIDQIALLLVADAFAPAVFNTGVPFGWVPTVELTVHVRAVPAPGPLRCVFRTRFVAGGMLEEDGEVWDAAGTLVAQSPTARPRTPDELDPPRRAAIVVPRVRMVGRTCELKIRTRTAGGRQRRA